MVPRSLLIALFTHTGLLVTKNKASYRKVNKRRYHTRAVNQPRTPNFADNRSQSLALQQKKGSKMKMPGRRSYPTPSELSKPGPDRSTGSRATEIRPLSSCKWTGA